MLFRVNLRRSGGVFETLTKQAKRMKPGLLRVFGEMRAKQKAAYSAEDAKQIFDEQRTMLKVKKLRVKRSLAKAYFANKAATVIRHEKALQKADRGLKNLYWASRGNTMPKWFFRPVKVTEKLVRVQVPVQYFATDDFKDALDKAIKYAPKILLEHLMGIRH